jgi:Ca-activated chloride channel family protein
MTMKTVRARNWASWIILSASIAASACSAAREQMMAASVEPGAKGEAARSEAPAEPMDDTEYEGAEIAAEEAPLAAPAQQALEKDARAQDGYNTESYDKIIENHFQRVGQKPLSTFSIDVDTASYSNVRRFLREGSLPPKGAVRIEELINYFSYSYAEPTKDQPFSVTTEISAAPWNGNHRLLHVGLRGRSVAANKMPPRNLVFLLDVSGSMNDANKLPLLRRSMKALLSTLKQGDRVAIAVYAGASGLVLPSTPATERQKILDALDRLSAGGSTNGGDGIRLAYEVAEEQMQPGSINRVILATDGDFNVGTTSQSELIDLIEKKRETGIGLTVLGFGMGNYKDSTLEKLADKGDGNYAYIDDIAEARKVLVREAGATLMTIAKDVKIQIEFNPAVVAGYRLIGYENRMLKDEDFNDDKKDAGEIGAGHTVTALYELIPVGQPVPTPGVDGLKYQSTRTVRGAATSGEVATIKLRYKQPTAKTSRLLSQVVKDGDTSLTNTSDAYRFSAAVATFGMLLRSSQYKGQADYDLVERLANQSLGSDPHGDRREFLSIVKAARKLSGS